MSYSRICVFSCDREALKMGKTPRIRVLWKMTPWILRDLRVFICWIYIRIACRIQKCHYQVNMLTRTASNLSSKLSPRTVISGLGPHFTGGFQLIRSNGFVYHFTRELYKIQKKLRAHLKALFKLYTGLG